MKSRTRRAPVCVKGTFSGMTLVEMLAALAVLAILAITAAPAFSAMLDKSRLKGAAERLYADFQWAKSQAIKTGRYVSVSFQIDPDNRQEWCYGIKLGSATAGEGCDCRTAGSCWLDENLNGVQDNGEGGRIVQSSEFPGVSISNAQTPFQGTASFGWLRGTVRAGNATFAVGDQKLLVRTNDIGRIKICAPTGSTVTGYPSCD